MESTRILHTLLDLWDDLPRLVGPAWPEVSARLASLLRDMPTIDERSQQAWFMSEVILLFRPHSEAVQHLRGALPETEQERGRGRQSGETTSPEAAQPWDALVHELRQRAHSPVVTRYTDIAYPRQLVWPYSHDWEDETPWCGTLRMTRWLRSDTQGRGTPPPPTRLRLHRLAILVPTELRGTLPSSGRPLCGMSATGDA